MKNNSLKFLLLSIFLASCGCGGGSSLVLTVQQFTSFSINEDDNYETIISSSTNKPANITYTISKPSPNANITISDSGALFYSPNPNYFGKKTSNDSSTVPNKKNFKFKGRKKYKNRKRPKNFSFKRFKKK